MTLAHDPGGKVRLPLPHGVTGSAFFSRCGRYRHWLKREWGPLPLEHHALWIGLNPSTAEADVDDPTIRREVTFTRAWGFHGYVKCNLLDYRATDPADLLMPGVEPCSPTNRQVIRDMGRMARTIVVCWGAAHERFDDHARELIAMLRDAGHDLRCLGLTKAGRPRHPLYLRADTRPIPFRGAL